VPVDVYMVRDDVWAAAGGATGNDWSGRRCRFLCLPCLQHRLGHALTRADLLEVPANDWLGRGVAVAFDAAASPLIPPP
jgi:hypothetical protein